MLNLISKNEKNVILKLFNIFKKNDTFSYLKNLNKQISIHLFPSSSVFLTGLVIKLVFNQNSNVFICIKDYLKNSIFFCSIKPKIKTKLLKLKHEEIYKILYEATTQNKKHLKLNNVTLQIVNNNDSNFASYFVEQLLNPSNLTKIQFFKNYSFNGCRKKKWLSG